MEAYLVNLAGGAGVTVRYRSVAAGGAVATNVVAAVAAKVIVPVWWIVWPNEIGAWNRQISLADGSDNDLIHMRVSAYSPPTFVNIRGSGKDFLGTNEALKLTAEAHANLNLHNLVGYYLIDG